MRFLLGCLIFYQESKFYFFYCLGDACIQNNLNFLCTLQQKNYQLLSISQFTIYCGQALLFTCYVLKYNNILNSIFRSRQSIKSISIFSLSANKRCAFKYSFSFMEIAKYDPLAIDSVPLNVKRAKKYSSVKTLILSLALLALDFLINWPYVKELYVGRNELEVQFKQKKSTNEKLTSTPICFTVPFGADIEMQGILMNSTGNITTFEVMQSPLDIYPDLQPLLDGKKYQCYDLSGNEFAFLDNMTFKNLQANTELQMHLRTMDLAEILAENGSTFYSRNITFSYTILWMDFMEMTFEDSWKVNYESDYQYGFANKSCESIEESFPLFTYDDNQQIVLFNSGFKHLMKNIESYTIFRTNVAEIIARLVAWKGILILIFSYIIGLYLQSEMKLDISKNRYQSKYLEGFDSSILTQIKRKLSGIKSGIFKEEIITEYYDRVEKDLDIVFIMRKFLLMQSVIEESQVINKEQEEEFQYFQIPVTDQILKQIDAEEDNEMSRFQTNEGESSSHYDEENQEKKGCPHFVANLIKSFICAFDFGETQFNIVPNKGNGHGSICNIFFLLVICGGMAGFLLFIGLFQIQTEELNLTMQPNTVQESIIPLTKDKIVLNYHCLMPPFLISYNHSFNLMENGEFVRQLEIKEGEQCLDLIKDKKDYEIYQKEDLGKWVCLDEDIELYQYGDQSRQIKINFTYSGMFSSYAFLRSYLFNIDSYYEGQNLTERVEADKRSPETLSYTTVVTFKYHDIENYLNDTVYNRTYQVFQRSAMSLGMGVSQVYLIDSYPNYSKSIYQSQSPWDVMDNAWGLVTLLFEILVIRISFMINNRLKKTNLNEEEENIRTNILFILGNIDRLLHGTFKKEIQSIPSYFKLELPQKQASLE